MSAFIVHYLYHQSSLINITHQGCAFSFVARPFLLFRSEIECRMASFILNKKMNPKVMITKANKAETRTQLNMTNPKLALLKGGLSFRESNPVPTCIADKTKENRTETARIHATFRCKNGAYLL